jgi:hypothetical protein
MIFLTTMKIGAHRILLCGVAPLRSTRSAEGLFSYLSGPGPAVKRNCYENTQIWEQAVPVPYRYSSYTACGMGGLAYRLCHDAIFR